MAPKCTWFRFHDGRPDFYINGALNTGSISNSAYPAGMLDLVSKHKDDVRVISTKDKKAGQADYEMCNQECISSKCSFWATLPDTSNCYLFPEKVSGAVTAMLEVVTDYDNRWIHTDYAVFGVPCEGPFPAFDFQPFKPDISKLQPCTQKLDDLTFKLDNQRGRVVLKFYPDVSNATQPDHIPNVKTTEACARVCMDQVDCNYWVYDTSTTKCFLWKEIPGDIDASNFNHWSQDDNGGGFGEKCSYFQKMKKYERPLDKCRNFHMHADKREAFFIDGAFQTGNLVPLAVPIALKNQNVNLVKSKPDKMGCGVRCHVNPKCKYWAYVPGTPDNKCFNWEELPDEVAANLENVDDYINMWAHIDGSCFSTACEMPIVDLPAPDLTVVPRCSPVVGDDIDGQFAGASTGLVKGGYYPTLAKNHEPIPHVTKRDSCARVCAEVKTCVYWSWNDEAHECNIISGDTAQVSTIPKFNQWNQQEGSAFGQKCSYIEQTRPRCTAFHFNTNRPELYIGGALNTGTVSSLAVPVAAAQLTGFELVTNYQECSTKCFNDLSCNYWLTMYPKSAVEASEGDSNTLRCFNWAELPKTVMDALSNHPLDYNEQWQHNYGDTTQTNFGRACKGDVVDDPVISPVKDLSKVTACTNANGASGGINFGLGAETGGQVVYGYSPDVSTLPVPQPVPFLNQRDSCPKACLSVRSCNFWLWNESNKRCYMWSSVPKDLLLSVNSPARWIGDGKNAFGDNCKFFSKMDRTVYKTTSSTTTTSLTQATYGPTITSTTTITAATYGPAITTITAATYGPTITSTTTITAATYGPAITTITAATYGPTITSTTTITQATYGPTITTTTSKTVSPTDDPKPTDKPNPTDNPNNTTNATKSTSIHSTTTADDSTKGSDTTYISIGAACGGAALLLGGIGGLITKKRLFSSSLQQQGTIEDGDELQEISEDDVEGPPARDNFVGLNEAMFV